MNILDLQNLLSTALGYLAWRDILDVVLIWMIVYRLLLIIKSTGTTQMLTGLAILGVVYLVSTKFRLHGLEWLLEKLFSNLFLILVVLFQAEIRKVLAHLGGNPFISGNSSLVDSHVIEEISKGAVQLAQKGFGALVVLEKEIDLGYFIEHGTLLDAVVSSELIVSLFDPFSPLHDGGTIIKGGKIAMAGCFLPLSKNPIIDKSLGTRHRAALGLTEETDAIVIVISEENRSVSVVYEGQLIPDLDHNHLRQELYRLFKLKYRKEKK